MLFNSIDFAIFLPLVFAIYWLLKSRNLVWQNAWIVSSSYVFYGWWDWRFLGLIFLSTIVDFYLGKQIYPERAKSRRKILLGISIFVNLGILSYFKYSQFFVENFVSAFKLFGTTLNIESLSIVLPVGISFYTFQTMSYTLDIYFGKTKPTNNFIGFAAFVSFFPQLVAGPIERASNLLPQFAKRREFNYAEAVDGLRQILWGLFKKMVIADNAAIIVNQVFNDSEQMNGMALLLGIIFFAFQIYGDFSGYSDIAIGTARLLGFRLMQNFAFPYFSRDIAEFWRRWHISLSTWFRDYLYIPLGGSKGSKWKVIRNTFIIFIVSGFWHGANWTFIFWGGLNALFFLPLLLNNKNRRHLDTVAKNRSLPGIKELFLMLINFGLVCFAWIFFRSESLEEAFEYIQGIIFGEIIAIPTITDRARLLVLTINLCLMILVEWSGRFNRHALETFGFRQNRFLRLSWYAFLIVLIGMLHPAEASPFIYFQF